MTYTPSDPAFDAALVHDAALMLADGSKVVAERDYYLGVAVRLGRVLEGQPTRSQILASSPRLFERSGKAKTLIEMIEGEPGDDTARFRLATLLMRALIWEPSSLSSAREALSLNKELIRYQKLLIERRLEELKKARIAPREGRGDLP